MIQLPTSCGRRVELLDFVCGTPIEEAVAYAIQAATLGVPTMFNANGCTLLCQAGDKVDDILAMYYARCNQRDPEAQARTAVDAFIARKKAESDDDSSHEWFGISHHDGWGTDYYKMTVHAPGQVAINYNN